MDPVLMGVAVKPAIKIVNRLFKPLLTKLEAEITGQSQVILHRLESNYSKYLENAVDRHSYFTSIVFKNEQRLLEDFYIPLTVVRGREKASMKLDGYPKKEIEKVKRLLIVDTAGMGKTTLLKFLFSRCVKQEAGVPIFVELRKLSRKKTLVDFIIDQLSDMQGRCKTDLFYRLLNAGEFTIFLDGYDEISEPERTFVTASVQEFIEKAPNNNYIITSRDEGGLAAFPSFQRYSITPLTRGIITLT